MRITFQEKSTNPPHPIMDGKSPIAKAFNKKQSELWAAGKFTTYDFEQVTTVLLEIFGDEYNKQYKVKKQKVKD